MRQNAITLASNVDAIMAKARSEGADLQSRSAVISALYGCVMAGALCELTEYSFIVYGGLVSPIPKNINPEIRLQQIETDLIALEQDFAVSMYAIMDDQIRCKELGIRGAKRSRMIKEIWAFATEAEAISLISKLDGFSDGYRAYFNGHIKRTPLSQGTPSYWEKGQIAAESFSKSGHKFLIGNGYSIRYNPLWEEYQVSHEEIGSVCSCEDFHEALEHCRKG
ncbi:hypothetical protein [Pseudoalteromonas lipolytica]|jgi:hypothetical protein|uniref:hypothetical protein n=1 Tax=Pseudoalteromonas lipolytica TaxID=570156 RepID=UPI003A980AD7